VNWERVLRAASGIDGVVEASSQFADQPALWVTGVEFAHVERTGWLSVRLGRRWAKSPEAAALAGNLRVRNGTSEWLLVGKEASDEQLRAFLERGVAFSRRPGHDGPPAPAEAELGRRRRRHVG
jgi:hypothetical protein